MSKIFLLILCFLPINNPSEIKDDVDLIVLNHCYDSKGNLRFDQYIFYDWSEQLKMFVIRDYRLTTNKNIYPQKNHHTRIWELSFSDSGVSRLITSPSYRESFTFNDPESDQRDIISIDQRSLLTKTCEEEN